MLKRINRICYCFLFKVHLFTAYKKMKPKTRFKEKLVTSTFLLILIKWRTKRRDCCIPLCPSALIFLQLFVTICVIFIVLCKWKNCLNSIIINNYFGVLKKKLLPQRARVVCDFKLAVFLFLIQKVRPCSVHRSIQNSSRTS